MVVKPSFCRCRSLSTFSPDKKLFLFKRWIAMLQSCKYAWSASFNA